MPDENEAANYDKVVIPKDDETRRALEAAMCKNILFSHLEVCLSYLRYFAAILIWITSSIQEVT